MASTSPPRRPRLSVARVVLFLFNVATTSLTVFSGLRENPLLVLVTGKYDTIRGRFVNGAINYEIAKNDTIRLDELTPLEEIGNTFRFITAPPRNLATINQDRSLCERVNSANSSVMGLNYDDMYGKATRRVQIYVHSISPPQCPVVNFIPAWYEDCVADRAGNATACHEFVLANFDALSRDRRLHIGAEKDFGPAGVPFMKCRGRPPKPFMFQMDIVTHQTYWSGGSHHMQVQTSDCMAEPMVRSEDWEWELFQISAVDDSSDVLLALPPAGWIATVVTAAYSIVTVVLIVRGLLATLWQSHVVNYLPNEVRFDEDKKRIKPVLPFMSMAALLTADARSVIHFKGSLLVASDLWMNHWLYIALSIGDAVVNVRLTYVTLQIATWVMMNKVTVGAFLFLCSALTKMAWLMCLVHTILRIVGKLLARSLKAMHLIKAPLRDRLEWYLDGTAMVMNFKMYNLLLCIILYILVESMGAPTLMKRQKLYKAPMYAGVPKSAGFWSSELVCDMATILFLLTLAGQAVGAVLLLATPYRHVVNNNVMRILQGRYIFVGWDGLLAAEFLGLDPREPGFLIHDRAYTSCSLGSLLQMLYLSGPSAYVHLAGDYIFVSGGFSKETVKFAYPAKRAIALGLCKSGRDMAYRKENASTQVDDVPGMTKMTKSRVGNTALASTSEGVEEALAPDKDGRVSAPTSLFGRPLRMAVDGYLGKTLLVDEQYPGTLTTNAETGLREFMVTDAISVIQILDIKPLLGNEKMLRIN